MARLGSLRFRFYTMNFLLFLLYLCSTIVPIEARRWSSIQEERWREISSIAYHYDQIEPHKERLASLEDLIHLESKNVPQLIQPLWIRCNSSTIIDESSQVCLARKINGLWQYQSTIPNITAHVYTNDDVHLLAESLLPHNQYSNRQSHTKLSTRQEALYNDLSLIYYDLSNLDSTIIWIGEGIILVVCGLAVLMAIHMAWNRLICPTFYSPVEDKSLMRTSEACVYVTSIMLGILVLTFLLLPPTLSYAKTCATLLMGLNLSFKFSRISYAFFHSFHQFSCSIPCLYQLQIIVLLTCLCVIPVFMTWLGFDSLGADRWSYFTGWYQTTGQNDLARLNFAFISPRLCDLLGLIFYVIFYIRLCKRSKCFKQEMENTIFDDHMKDDSVLPVFLTCNLVMTCLAFINPCLVLFASLDTYYGAVFHVLCETSGLLLFGLFKGEGYSASPSYTTVTSRPLSTHIFIRPPSSSSSSSYHTLKKSDHPHQHFYGPIRKRHTHTD